MLVTTDNRNNGVHVTKMSNRLKLTDRVLMFAYIGRQCVVRLK